MGLRATRSVKDLKDLDTSASVEDIITRYNEVIKELNFVLKALSFQSNFNGYIAEVSIPATSSLQIQHFLGVTPKWRVILRQEGNGVISDIPSGWNERYITVYNNGAGVVTASIWIVRE